MSRTKERTTALVLVQRTQAQVGPCLTMDDVARACGLREEIVHRFHALGLIDPLEAEAQGKRLFGPEVIWRVKKIMRLRRDLGINLAGAGVVLDLLDRIDVLENRIRELERMLQGER